jgi:chromosome segregation ATPase
MAPADVDVKQRLFHSPAVAARDIGVRGDEVESTLVNESDARAYARVLELRLAEMEEEMASSRDDAVRGRCAALEAKCAALRGENARLKKAATGRGALTDVTNAASGRVESTPMRHLKSRLNESDAAMATERALREDLARARAERAAAEKASASAAEKVREVQTVAAENEDWLVRALEVKCAEMEKLEARQRELGKRCEELTEALGVSERRLGETLTTLDEHRTEAKSIIKREKKHAKALHDKYKSSKREKAELVREVADLRLVAAKALESSRRRFSYRGAVESSLKMATLALEYPDPFAAAVVVLWHAAASFIQPRGGFLRVVGFLRAAESSASPLDFDVSGFASVFPSSST